MTAPELQIHYADDWAALYVDGKLDRVGDTYNTEERALALAGVETVHDDAFMRGQSQRDGVAQTIDEVAAYARERDERLALAAQKREQAERLLAEAGELEADRSR